MNIYRTRCWSVKIKNIVYYKLLHKFDQYTIEYNIKTGFELFEWKIADIYFEKVEL